MAGSATRTITVVPLTADHADEVVAIHQAGMDEGNATFETVGPDLEAVRRGQAA